MTVATDACPRCGYVLDQPPAPAPPPLPPVTSYAAPYPAPAPPPREHRGLSTASVPQILLGLGATCLLVAAAVFLAVAWTWLGVGGRTAVLVLLTAATAGGGQLLARRELGVAAEALTTVALGLLVLDVVGADRAGWLGGLDTDAVISVVGLVVLVAALVLTASRLATPQVVAPFAVGLTALGFADLTAAAGAVVGCAALARFARARRLPVLPWTSLSVGLLAYGVLGLGALDLALADGTRLWLLVGAALALLPWAMLPGRDEVRQLCCAFAASVLTFTAAVPVYDESLTAVALAACAGVAFWAVVAAATPQRWYAVPRLPLLGSVVVLVPLVGLLAATALGNLVSVAPLFTAPASVRLDPAAAALHPLVLPLGVAVVVGAALVTSRSRWSLLGLPVAALTAALTAALYPLPLWLFVVVLGPFGVLVAGPSAVLTFGSLAVTVLVAGWLLVRGRLERVAGAALPVALAGLVWTGGHLLEADPGARSLVVLGVVGLLALAVPRPEVGATAATVAVLAATAGVTDAFGLAVHLTLAGALVTATSLVHHDRRLLAWPGGALLAAATWVRLWEIGVTAPEAYTLPAAVVLVLVGAHRAHTSARLLPGLLLATVPSLLWALAEPVSLRAALLGLGSLVLVLAGAHLRWSAPLVVGAVVGALLVLRELAPYAAQTPQWLLIGAAGTVLIGAGVTWESRVRDLRRTTAYLGRLR